MFREEASPYQEAEAAPQPEADPIAELTKLGELKASGILTEEAFEKQKQKILNQM